MTHPMTTSSTAELVRTAQLAQQRIRGIRRNGGRTAATTKALAGWQFAYEIHVDELLRRGETRLAGELTAEADLAERLRTDSERPELRARLVATRRDIRRRVQVTEAAR